MESFCKEFLPAGRNSSADWCDPKIHKHEFDSLKGFIVTSLLLGCAVGSLGSRFVADSFLGRRGTIQLACFLVCLGAAGQCFAPSYVFFNGSRLVAGLGIGFSSALTPVYISEIAFANKRGMMVTFNQLSMTGGIAIAFWIGWATQHYTHGWQWSIAAQTIPALFLFLGLFSLPASPRWLAERGELVRAQNSLIALGRDEKTANFEMEEIERSIQEEQSSAYGTSVLLDSKMRLRVFIAVMLQTFQQLTGINVIMFYAPKIFTDIGIKNSELLATAGFGVINFLATFIAFFLLDKVGRKMLLTVGGIIMCFSMSVLGALGTIYYNINDESLTSNVAGWICIVCVYVFVVGFAMSWGPVVWLIPTELLPTAQRAKGVSLSTAANWIWGLAVGQFVPRLQDELNFKLYFVFAGLAIVMVIFVQLVVPETKGKSLEEINRALGISGDGEKRSSNEEKTPLLVNS